ncbi:diguanylate cyclase domain-containing protein [Deinococcus cellulosilyticus]|uniref:Serine/threonine protein kinase n=1 Tax=Deinococcus cellulosilyticus (strain DSM 18568 / NBRC 106333 / KACC 11606 / 5516J-15) TaxID=1223518 RepID=A0A511N179_DEIC1|nr:diguanylate cyclase [Deinococcus cellulosilyticus]GEM46227.1 serine/threonine protein kinase [Deinococcus cellulosilyticus NBRC 106333 = KACC 11606]
MQSLLYASRNTVIYRVWDEARDQPVVVKVLTGQQRTSGLALLQREFEMTRRMEKAGFRKALDYGEYQGQPALYLEYVPGETLQDHFEHEHSLEHKLELAAGLARQLGLVHQQGIVHKDVGYHNVIVGEDGRVHLIDFGLSSPLARGRTRNTELAVMEGSFPFMSPEQTGRVNRSIDQRSDLYSLGVVLYWMFTGRLPFQADHAVEWVHLHMAVAPVPPDQLNPALPGFLSQVILKLLSKNPEDRYQSAYGVVQDLQRALSPETKDAPVGAFDRMEQHQFPQKLYGRDPDLRHLEQLLSVVRHGGSQWVQVSGDAGVGKSELLLQLQGQVIKQQGHFVAGKYSPLQQVPASGLIQAVQQLIRQLMAESDMVRSRWTLNLQQALGPLVGVMLPVVPELEWLLGPQPPVPELPFQEHENRFMDAFVRLLQGFAMQDAPLVLVLDDLQWADPLSVRVLNHLITSADTHHVLLLTAHQDTAIQNNLPVHTLLGYVQDHPLITELVLQPLDLPDVQHFLADTLNMPAEAVASLAQVVADKTAGMPFFMLEFIEALIENEVLHFDHDLGTWQWDLEKANQQHATDNTLDRLSRRVQEFPEATRQTLFWLAVLGQPVEIGHLAKLRQESADHTMQALFPALDAGLLILTGEEVRFTHDRILQQVYQQIPSNEQAALHLQLGRSFEVTPEQTDAELFQQVHHLILGLPLIEDPTERIQVAELCLQAARKARTSTAYRTAMAFLDAGLLALGDVAWTHNGKLAFDLTLEALQARFLLHDPEGAEIHFQSLVQHVKDPVDLAEVYASKIDLLTYLNRYPECVQLGIQALGLFGIQVPETGLQEASIAALRPLLGEVMKRGLPGLLTQSEMPDDPALQVQMRLLTTLVTVGYFSHPAFMMFVLVEQLKLTLQHGNSQQSVVAYYGTALMLVSSGNIDLAWGMMQVSLALAERYGHPFFLSRAKQVFGTLLCHWKQPPLSSLPFLDAARDLARESGDPTYTVFSILPMYYAHYNAGHHLEHLERCIQEHLEVVKAKPHALLMTRMQEMFVELMRGDHTEQLESCSLIYQQHMENAIVAMKNLPVEHRYHSLQTVLQYLSGDLEAALKHTEICHLYRQKNVSMGVQMNVEDTMMQALILLALHPTRIAEQRTADLEQVRENLQMLESWSHHAPMNYRHQALLVAAELARAQGQMHEARDRFEEALNSLQGSVNHKDTALTLERFSEFLRAQGNRSSADLYLKEAHQAYRRWGARVKALQLERLYPQLFVQDAALRPSSRMTSITTVSEQHQSSRLDVLAFTQASLVISSEIVLENLLNRMMVTVTQSAGAQRVVLLLKDQEQFFIEATHDARQEQPQVLMHEPIHDLPLSVIQYVLQTRETVVEGNARTSQRFQSELHFRTHETRSMLCTPILHQGEVKGVLYLENNLASHVFTERQVQVLQLLSSQMAISIEHARLYSHLEDLVQERTHDLEMAYQELQKSQEAIRHMAYHDALTGLPNRKLLSDRLEKAFARCRRHGGSVGMVYLDLDGFKGVNDTLGHDAGDQLLIEVASRLLQVVRETDTVARMGGDEFVVLLEPVISTEELQLVASRILQGFQPTVTIKGEVLHLRSSLGLSLRREEDTPEALMQRADNAMYVAKRQGKNRWVLDAGPGEA